MSSPSSFKNTASASRWMLPLFAARGNSFMILSDVGADVKALSGVGADVKALSGVGADGASADDVEGLASVMGVSGWLLDGGSMKSPSISSCPSSTGMSARHFNPTPSGGVMLLRRADIVLGGGLLMWAERKEVTSCPTRLHSSSLTRWSSSPFRSFKMKFSFRAFFTSRV